MAAPALLALAGIPAVCQAGWRATGQGALGVWFPALGAAQEQVGWTEEGWGKSPWKPCPGGLEGLQPREQLGRHEWGESVGGRGLPSSLLL